MADSEIANTTISDQSQSGSETAAELAAQDEPEDAERPNRCDYALISEAGNCAVAKIIVGKRRRALDPAKVDQLAASMHEVGLRHPITVTPTYEGDPEAQFKRGKKVYANRMRLVAGLHRLEAAKKLGWRTISVTVIPDGYPLHCELFEIDENLARAELTELERGEHLADRKAIYEQLYPETKAGTAQALGMHQALGHDVSDNLAPTFAEDTAAKTGLSQRTVERVVRRAENIAPEVRDEIRTMPEIADSGVELDALSKAASEQQAEAVKAVKQGTAKTIREAISHGPKPTPIPRPPVVPQRKVSMFIGTPREQWIEMMADQYKAPVSQLYERLSETARLVNDAKNLDEIPRPKREHLARRFAAALGVPYLLKEPDSTTEPEGFASPTRH